MRKDQSLFIRSGSVPPSPCPRCRQVLDAATGVAALWKDARPSPGALTLCIECCTWCTFTFEMRLRLATDAEIAQVDPHLRKLVQEVAMYSPAAKRKH